MISFSFTSLLYCTNFRLGSFLKETLFYRPINSIKSIAEKQYRYCYFWFLFNDIRLGVPKMNLQDFWKQIHIAQGKFWYK